MNKAIGKSILVTLLLTAGIFQTGCTIGSMGVIDPGFTRGDLRCRITEPPTFSHFHCYDNIWIYGVVYREGSEVDRYPWDGPLWHVDNGTINPQYYVFGSRYDVVEVSFPFDAFFFGPGRHTITLSAEDYGSKFAGHASDSIEIFIDY